MLIESFPTNALATYKTLADFGAPLAQFTVEDLADGKTIPAPATLPSASMSYKE